MKTRLKSRDIAPGVRVTSQDHDWVDSFVAESVAQARRLRNVLWITAAFSFAIGLLLIWWYRG